MIPEIKARNLKFEFKKPNERFWLKSCPVQTYHANVLAAYIPIGERFFIRCVKPFYHQIQELKLKAQVRAFLQQEGHHHREHVKYYKQVVQSQYPKLQIERYRFRLIEALAFMGGKRFRLGMAAAGEHFTAVLADLYLNHPEWFEGVPKEIAQIWRWHFIEEIEHKAVVFDLMAYLKTGYFIRASSFLLLSCLILSAYIRPFFHMAKTDKQLRLSRFYSKSCKFYWKKPGLFIKGLKPFFAYLKPGFHPWQHDNSQLIKKFSQ